MGKISAHGGEEEGAVQTLEVSKVAFSPDGVKVASVRDDTVRLSYVSNKKLLHRLKGHTGRVNDIAFSPDGSTLVSASDDWTVKLWDTASGRLLRTLEGHRSRVSRCAFSPDGRFVVSVGDYRPGKAATPGSPAIPWDEDGRYGPATLGRPAIPGLPAIPAEPDTLRLWDPKSGRELRKRSFDSQSLDFYLNSFERDGIEFGPIVVTALRRDGVLTVRCPACYKQHRVKQDQLGRVMTCPRSKCGEGMRINSFVKKLEERASVSTTSSGQDAERLEGATVSEYASPAAIGRSGELK